MKKLLAATILTATILAVPSANAWERGQHKDFGRDNRIERHEDRREYHGYDHGRKEGWKKRYHKKYAYREHHYRPVRYSYYSYYDEPVYVREYPANGFYFGFSN